MDYKRCKQCGGVLFIHLEQHGSGDDITFTTVSECLRCDDKIET